MTPKFLRKLHPTNPGGQILVYSTLRILIVFVSMLVYRYRAFHASRVPTTGPLLIVSNHQSMLDPPMIGAGIPGRQLDYVARVGLFKSPLFAWLIRMLNAVPLRQDEADTKAIKTTLEKLKNGCAVLVFPEGARTTDGAVHGFKRGAAVLVKRANCPVLPVAIAGAYHAWPRSRKRPLLIGQRITVAYGRPIDPEDLLKDGPDAALERLRKEVEALYSELAERTGRDERPSEQKTD